jgi:glutaminyl-peptide cyclotransferase
MQTTLRRIQQVALCLLLATAFAGCKAKTAQAEGAASPPPVSDTAGPPTQEADADTLAPEKTGGFDGKRAFDHVAKQVGFGPRPAGSQAIAQTQDYILSQLTADGCTVETDAFNAQTPDGVVPMKNILVKIPGERAGIIMLATHYDTKKMDLFVGADDAGSSTGVMLELARLLCAAPQRHPVWIAFFDGEEAVHEWSDTDSRYGSREMAAKLAMSGDLKKIQAFLLADIVGSRTLRFKRESNSDKGLTDLVWKTAKRLGYGTVFENEEFAIEDDHLSFTKRGVPCVDVIDLEIPYWHTPQDTLDKIGSKSLAITGHVFVETIKQLQAK